VRISSVTRLPPAGLTNNGSEPAPILGLSPTETKKRGLSAMIAAGKQQIGKIAFVLWIFL
jgi:hypothetical protein